MSGTYSAPDHVPFYVEDLTRQIAAVSTWRNDIEDVRDRLFADQRLAAIARLGLLHRRVTETVPEVTDAVSHVEREMVSPCDEWLENCNTCLNEALLWLDDRDRDEWEAYLYVTEQLTEARAYATMVLYRIEEYFAAEFPDWERDRLVETPLVD